MARLKKSIVLPAILFIYLAVMSVIGWQNWQAGKFSALYYFGLMALTLLCIILLHFSLRRRERQRQNKIK